jgi:uncharacterized protein
MALIPAKNSYVAMQYNVAQLLKERTGARRAYHLSGSGLVLEEIPGGAAVDGDVEFLRTQKSILVKGRLEGDFETTCSRCLIRFHVKAPLVLEEEFFPLIDLATGSKLPKPDDPAAFTIDEHHVLDLWEPVRQSLIVAVPMRPLCRPDCAGLCPECGADLNVGPCEHAGRASETGREDLRALRDRLIIEESRQRGS